jgi:peroxiredoxin Q/BCP
MNKERLMVAIGEQAPDFALPNQNGQQVKLSQFRGQKVILFAFPKAGTGGCTAQACGFRDSLPQIQAQNAVVLGISTDRPDELKRWHTAQNLSYDLLSDPKRMVIDQWNAGGMSILGIVSLPFAKRSYWVIDENGIVIDMQIGIAPGESVKKALKAVQSAEASAGAS